VLLIIWIKNNITFLIDHLCINEDLEVFLEVCEVCETIFHTFSPFHLDFRGYRVRPILFHVDFLILIAATDEGEIARKSIHRGYLLPFATSGDVLNSATIEVDDDLEVFQAAKHLFHVELEVEDIYALEPGLVLIFVGRGEHHAGHALLHDAVA